MKKDKPNFSKLQLIFDIILWVISFAICMVWRVAAHKSQILVYCHVFLAMMIVWLVAGLLTRKYRSYKELWFWQEFLSMLIAGGCSIALIYIIHGYQPTFSTTVALWGVIIVMLMDTMGILITHYRKYALNMTTPPMTIEQRNDAFVRHPSEQRSPESIEAIHQSVLSLTTEEDYQMLLNKAHLDNRQTKAIANRDRFSFMQIPDYAYLTLVDLTVLNDAKGINRRFCIVNQKLPDNGNYVCCYHPQEYAKAKILASYPKGINRLAVLGWFIVRRVIPRLMLFSRLYYDVTGGHRRMLSKTEVLGRLYYCGFEVDEVVSMGKVDYVFAHRHSQPYPQENNKIYGPLIRLPRVCKDKKIVDFYKLRTMHPYSEYIQKYVFDQHGGMNIADKSDNDWRITDWGRVLRRYWLDELPMLINWLKGDVKLVGVRPLSQAMFSQYPPELQDKRTRCKPGLIPPFYIDHPKTFDELCASENNYLDEYFAHPFITDVKYFFRTVYSILFRRMHSA